MTPLPKHLVEAINYGPSFSFKNGSSSSSVHQKTNHPPKADAAVGAMPITPSILNYKSFQKFWRVKLS